MQRAHEGLKGLGKILQPLQKQYGHAQQLSQDTQSYDCEDRGQKSQAMSKYKSYNKKPIVKYIHNKIFLFIMMFSSSEENNYRYILHKYDLTLFIFSLSNFSFLK